MHHQIFILLSIKRFMTSRDREPILLLEANVTPVLRRVQCMSSTEETPQPHANLPALVICQANGHRHMQTGLLWPSTFRQDIITLVVCDTVMALHRNTQHNLRAREGS